MLVKGNQPDLLQALEAWFNGPWIWRNLDSRTATALNKGHGRIEQRRIWVSAACGYLDWPDVQQVIRFDTQIISTQTGEVTSSRVYAITSLSPQEASARRLLDLKRQHWAIENHLHYPRDVWFREDASRVRSGQAPRMMASCRNAVLNLLRTFGYCSLKRAREQFAANPSRALGLLELPISFRLE
jgi:predicted transposase YbfD/YdcC